MITVEVDLNNDQVSLIDKNEKILITVDTSNTYELITFFSELFNRIPDLKDVSLTKIDEDTRKTEEW